MLIAIVESEDGPQAVGPFRERDVARKISANVIPLRPNVADIGRPVAEREAETLYARRLRIMKLTGAIEPPPLMHDIWVEWV